MSKLTKIRALETNGYETAWHEREGVYVPHTGKVLAVTKSSHTDGWWAITHVPTGLHVGPFATQAKALRIAGEMYSRIRCKGDFNSDDEEKARGAVPMRLRRWVRDQEDVQGTEVI